jgi:hypothetical protein
MALCISPITAFALDYTEETNINTDYFSFMIYSTNDFVANVLEGVSKDKVITVTKGKDAVVVLNAGEYMSSNRGDVDFTSLTTGAYHYGSSSSYCISTNTPFTLTGDGITAEVSGFGSQSYSNNSGYGGSQTNTAIATTFTIKTDDIEVGEHTLTLTYKYELKSYKNYSWKSNGGSYEGTVENITLNVVSDEPTVPVDDSVVANGGSIRIVGTPGLRYGFQTTTAPDDVKEYGFIYAYADTDDLTVDSENVIKKVATNFIDHGDYTTFNLVFTGITSANFDTVVSARSYVITNDGEIHYSAVLKQSFNIVADKIINDNSGDIDDATKEAVRELLNA